MDDAPHPRVLFESVADETLLTSLTALAPTNGVLGEDVLKVHASDWDLVVSFHPQPEQPEGVHVLAFGGANFGQTYFGHSWYAPRRNLALHARSVVVPDNLQGPLRSLVQRSVIARDPGPGRVGLSGLPPGKGRFNLAVAGTEREPWAAFFRRREGAWVWALPEETTDHVAWLASVLELLHDVDPDRFPGSPDWQRKHTWGTPETRRAITALATIDNQRRAILDELASREARARVELELAASEAASGPQRALTADGPDLETAVAGLLTDLGYMVEQMDSHHSLESGGRLEDLRVSVPGQAWTCLVEVKGYTSGARVRDVPRITGRPSVRFAATEGRAPDAVWHIVNAWRGTEPGTREVAVPQEHDLAVLAEAHGCLIDTRDLFAAWRDVREGVADADAVRSSMQAAVGRWRWPSPASASSPATRDDEAGTQTPTAT
ncbi:hypothetical protein ICW40_05805 [Actinotalea ferrariae]|uniref:hypothetical protein n=1 Tax=Actinotalea ferrariae TaxID=1386098 RepID=UPI001C8C2109|nr:hypothetical protein [Actinotalea ferrariae]MBX9244321.1 hypothetical protein [Actinotalea ferrariae]